MKARIGIIVTVLVLGIGAGVFLASKIALQLRSEQLHSALLKAEVMLNEGKADEAVAVLAPWRGKSARGEMGERRLRLDMEALDTAGRAKDARDVAERYISSFPEGIARADAEFINLRPELEKKPNDPKLREQADALLAKYPDHPGVARLQVAMAKAELAAGHTNAARERLLSLWDAGVPASEREAVAELLGDINMNMLFSAEPQPGDTVVKLKEGQYLYHIAKDTGVPMELLLKVNNITDAKRMRVGQEIRVPKVQFSLLCDKAENTLTVYNEGRFFKQYAVRTGRDATSTPPGEYKILNKKKDPTWRSPIDGKTYKPGDPGNELGTRWMAFEGDSLGIHGTIHPETVGHYASNGCIGMRTSEIEELFDMVSVGTPLRIVGKQDLTRHRIIKDGGAGRSELASKR